MPPPAPPVADSGKNFTLSPIHNHPEHIPEGSSFVDAQGNVVNPSPGQTPESSQLSELIARQEAERAAREARIRDAINAINSVFGGREGVFDQYADTSFDLNRERLEDQRGDTARNLKFALARAGTLGGSADVDRHAELDERFGNELVDARSFSDDRAAQLRSSEEALKSGLLGAASSGNVTGAQAGGLARGALSATESSLNAPAVSPTLGASFGGISDIIGQALLAAGMRQGRQGVPGGGNEFSSFFPGSSSRREEGTIS